VRHNVIFDRARFNQRNQHPGETAEEYITVLHKLAQGCQYGKMTEESIRNQLAVGIRDKLLSELESDLTLEKAKKLVRQKEAIQQQQSILKGNKDTLNDDLDEMYMNCKLMSGKPQKRVLINPILSKQTVPAQTNISRRCGKKIKSPPTSPCK